MKLLISNYSSDSTTEPLYLNASLNKVGCESNLLQLNTSIYDGFDKNQPDVYIAHHEYLSKDLLVYLKDGGNKKVDLIINISNMSQENLSKLDSILSENNIKLAFYFVNNYDTKLHSRNNIVSLLHGADLFLTSEPKQYSIDYAIFIDNKSQIRHIDGSYHYITYDKGIDQVADLYFPIHRLSHLYQNYNKVVFRYFHGIFTQAFFDSAVRTKYVYFDVDNDELLRKHLTKLLGEEGLCDLSNENSGDIMEIIMNKHTCLNRTKSLLSQLPAKEYVDNLQKLIENRGKI